jgi:hypothetical protein
MDRGVSRESLINRLRNKLNPAQGINQPTKGGNDYGPPPQERPSKEELAAKIAKALQEKAVPPKKGTSQYPDNMKRPPDSKVAPSKMPPNDYSKEKAVPPKKGTSQYPDNIKRPPGSEVPPSKTYLTYPDEGLKKKRKMPPKGLQEKVGAEMPPSYYPPGSSKRIEAERREAEKKSPTTDTKGKVSRRITKDKVVTNPYDGQRPNGGYPPGEYPPNYYGEKPKKWVPKKEVEKPNEKRRQSPNQYQSPGPKRPPEEPMTAKRKTTGDKPKSPSSQAKRPPQNYQSK